MASQNPTFEFATPVGRLVQGSPIKQHLKDMDTNQLEYDDDGKPVMGIFIALAFPKNLPNGQGNPEFDSFWGSVNQAAAALWPGLFANGQQPARFSWKYQDGDGVNGVGQAVSDKQGFAGHHIVKFKTSFDVNCFIEGNFAPHQQLQKPEDQIKRGYWVRLIGKIGSNGATGTKVPGIILYPNLLSLVGGSPVDELKSGPDAAAAFGAAALGYVPQGVARPGEVPAVAAGGGVPNVAVPSTNVPVVHTPSVPTVSTPQVPVVHTPSVPTVSTPQVPVVNVPQVPVVPVVPGMPVATPQYAVNPALGAVTLDMLLAPGAGWTIDTALAAGHITRVG